MWHLSPCNNYYIYHLFHRGHNINDNNTNIRGLNTNHNVQMGFMMEGINEEFCMKAVSRRVAMKNLMEFNVVKRS